MYLVDILVNNTHMNATWYNTWEEALTNAWKLYEIYNPNPLKPNGMPVFIAGGDKDYLENVAILYCSSPMDVAHFTTMSEKEIKEQFDN